jgi:hypothetical protein
MSSDKTLIDLSNSILIPDHDCNDDNLDTSCLEHDDTVLPMSPRPNSPITTQLMDFDIGNEVNSNLNVEVEVEVEVEVGEVNEMRMDDSDARIEADSNGTDNGNGSGTNSTDSTVGVSNTISLILHTKLGIIDTIKNQLLQEFTTLLYNITPLNKSGLMKMMIRAMEIVETTSITDGKDRLDIVIDVLTYILNSEAIVCANKDQLISFLTDDANDLIAIIIDASKGKINVNKLENVVTKTMNTLFTCICPR